MNLYKIALNELQKALHYNLVSFDMRIDCCTNPTMFNEINIKHFAKLFSKDAGVRYSITQNFNVMNYPSYTVRFYWGEAIRMLETK